MGKNNEMVPLNLQGALNSLDLRGRKVTKVTAINKQMPVKKEGLQFNKEGIFIGREEGYLSVQAMEIELE